MASLRRVSTPAPLRRAAVLVALEGAALAVAGAVFAVLALTGDPEDRSGTVLLFVLVLGLGVAVLVAARGLARGEGWAWAPTILLQVFGLVAAVGALQAGAPVVAVPLGLLAGAVLYQLATPEARAARD
jgi:hypothetical protein